MEGFVYIPIVQEIGVKVLEEDVRKALPSGFSKRGIQQAIDNLTNGKCRVVKRWDPNLKHYQYDVLDPEIGFKYTI